MLSIQYNLCMNSTKEIDFNKGIDLVVGWDFPNGKVFSRSPERGRSEQTTYSYLTYAMNIMYH